VLEAGTTAVCLLDAGGAVRYATPEASRLLGVPREALLGRAFESLVAEDHVEDVRFVLNAFSRKPGGQHETEFTCAASDGRGRYLSACWVDRLKTPPVSAIIVSLRDLTEVRRAVSLQSALYRIAARASSVGEIGDFYASVHAIIGELLDAKNFFIAIYDAAADLIRFPYFVDESGDTPDPLPPGNTLTAIVLRTGQPLFLTEEVFNAMAARGEAGLVGAPSADWLGVPLKIRGETVGVIAVQSYVPTARYVESEKKILMFVAQHVGAALEQKRAVEALRDSEERYRQLFERNLAGVFRCTVDGRLLDCNDAFVRIFGYGSRDEILATDAHDLYSSPQARDDFVAQVRRTGSAVNAEILGRRGDGSPVWILQSVSLVAGSPGQPPMLEGTVVDITDRKRVESQIEHLAFHDALTGLPNRSLFDDRLEIALARCRRDGGQLAILFLDLDRFKRINDTLGHEAGDRLLRAVADRLRDCVREEDTIARVGGDEFVILAEGVGDSDARMLAEKILRTIAAEPFSIPGASLPVTASIGVSVFPDHGTDPARLVRSADDAMYAVKAAGRNSCGMAVPES
jgi:diguanylate cyclase (GGDEF)-like protein/PAS domain S-box-containing protein